MHCWAAFAQPWAGCFADEPVNLFMVGYLARSRSVAGATVVWPQIFDLHSGGPSDPSISILKVFGPIPELGGHPAVATR